MSALVAAVSEFPETKFKDTFALSSSVSLEEVDSTDDIKIEEAIKQQALAAVVQAKKQILSMNIPFSRPSDFFAEMLKTDEHMQRVKQELLNESLAQKNKEEAKKQRLLKKFGKKVQQQKLLERQKQKSQELEKIKLARKVKKTVEDGDDDGLEISTFKDEKKPRNSSKNTAKPDKSAKRKRKDEKFGFGGQKRFKKSNTSESTDDLKGFSVKKMKQKAFKKQRPGKSRRANSK